MPLSANDSFRSDYSFGDRLLHQMVLGLPWVGKASFDIDGMFSKKCHETRNAKHVFISGLARAGSTILMRTFYNTGLFRSLTYRDMPFVLMPGLWQRVVKVSLKEGTLQQRAHGDGIFVDYDSPEAFEDVFWRTYAGENYILDDRLIPHDVDVELIRRFRLYVDRLLATSRKLDQGRYLSKNNNNILRIRSIHKAFVNSVIIIPFRDAVQQSVSLLEQHKRFSDNHRTDRFAYNYMQWLGHYEFGLTHRRFCFDDNGSESLADYRPDSINYWLSLWNSTYRYLIDTKPVNSVFVCYEDLCNYPMKTLSYLFELADLPSDANIEWTSFVPIRKNLAEDVDERLRSRGESIYAELLDRQGHRESIIE